MGDVFPLDKEDFRTFCYKGVNLCLEMIRLYVCHTS